MSYLNLFRQRTLSNGNKQSEGIINASKQTIKNNFNNSLFTEKVLINAIEFDAIITQKDKSEDKKILFMPDTKVDIGSVVELNSNSYLIMDFLSEGINEIYPTGTLKLCNSIYPIKSVKTKVLKRDSQGKPVTDKFGDPVYIYTDGATTNLPCIVESSIIAADENKQLPLPQGQLRVTLSYRDDVKVNDTFPMYNNTYKIRGIDYTKVINGKGIMALSVEQVQSEVK